MTVTRETIQVTREDINQGLPNSPPACPVARAIKRLSDSPLSVWVGSSTATVDGRDYMMDEQVTEWIDSLDRGQAVQPMSITVDHQRHLIRVSRKGERPGDVVHGNRRVEEVCESGVSEPTPSPRPQPYF